MRTGYLDTSASATTNSTVALDWDNDATGITNFKVEYKKSADETWEPTSYTGTISHFTVTGLEFNTAYDFRVAAENTARSTISSYATVSETTLRSGPSVRTTTTTWETSEVYVCTVDGEWPDEPNASMYACASTGPTIWKAVG